MEALRNRQDKKNTCKWCAAKFPIMHELAKHIKVCPVKNNRGGAVADAFEQIEEKKAYEDLAMHEERKNAEITIGQYEGNLTKQNYLKEYVWLSQSALSDQMQQYMNAITINGTIPKNFQCAICQHFVYQPVICTYCEITVSCKNCYEKWNAKPEEKQGSALLNGICNNARCDANVRSMPAPKLLSTMMNSLPTQCLKPNCPSKGQKMTVGEYQMHIKHCAETSIDCANGCGNVVRSVKDAEEHFEICGMLEIPCVQCGQFIKRKDTDEHMIKCNESYTNCDLCDARLRKDKQDVHKERECPEGDVQCARCKLGIKRREQGQHDCKSALVAACSERTEVMRGLEQELASIRAEGNDYRQRLAFMTK